MKILHVIGKADFGGINRLVLSLCRAQDNLGKESAGVLFTEMCGEYLDMFKRSKIDLCSAELRSGYHISFSKYKIIKNIYENYDILHFHSFNPFLALCAIGERKPVVYMEHGNFGFGRKTKISDRIKRVLLRLFLNRYVKYVTFNSKFTRTIALERYGLKKLKSSVVYNGIDFHDLENASGTIDEDIRRKISDKFIVGTSSRFAGFKRIDRLIEAFADFQQGKIDVILLLVGDGITRGDLEKTARNLKIEKKCLFTGYRENVYDFQKNINVCVFPSQGEPFGLVAVEALYMGKPTVVFNDGGGIVEIIEGISSDDVVNNVSDLSARLNYYYNRRPHTGDDNSDRKEYAKRFDIAVMANKISDIYRAI